MKKSATRPERVTREEVRPPVRREDLRLITGQGRYVDDIPLVDSLFVTFVRSPVAHGRIVSIDSAEAEAMPGVVAVYHGAHTARLGDLPVNSVLETTLTVPYPVLAHEKVHAVGQPVAAVVASSDRHGLDAADHVLVGIEELDGSASVSADHPGPQLFETIPDNMAGTQSWKIGDVDAVFEAADHIVEASVTHPRLAPSPMEPRAIAVEYDRGDLTVWLSTQTPHRSRDHLASLLDIGTERIRLVSPDVGGAFGMKASLYPEEVFAAWAALTLKRSVRWTATRSEEFLSAAHGRGTATQGWLAVSGDGKFLALKARSTSPLGHWLTNSAVIPAWNVARILPGPYDIDMFDLETRAVISNTAAVGIYRGAGRPEVAALLERLADKAAHRTGLDPVEIRKRNLVRPEQMPHKAPTGRLLDSGRYGDAIELLCRNAGYDELQTKKERRRRDGEVVGLGLAFYVEPCGRGWESASVTFNPDGTLEAATGGSTQGHGRETAFAQVVADVFDVDPAMVTVCVGDTETCPSGIGALASRSTAIGASALMTAAEKVRDKMAGRNDTQEPLCETVIYETGGEAWGYGCYLATVSIDRSTGTPSIENMFCLDDAGNIIDHRMVEGQLLGGIAQGIGEALLENIVYDDNGQLITGSFADYAMPRATDMPVISIDTMCTPSPLNALGAKGVGEAGTIGAPAAILNAISDALAPFGAGDLPMPLTGERIWRALRQGENTDEL